jgi:hypothetical protein
MASINRAAAISADLLSALSGHKALSQALYEAVLMDYEAELQTSLDSDADDALLCMLAEEGEVAMLLVDWDGHVHRNADALRQLQAMWSHSFDANILVLVPVLSEYISQNHLGVAGIKWTGTPADTKH